MSGLAATLDRFTHKPWRAVAVVFVLAFAIRMFLLLNYVPERAIAPHTRWEAQAIAVSLAERGEYADPYAIPTGPTAHLPPVAPGLAGLIYRALGLTLAAGYVVWILRLVAASAICAMLPWIAGRFGMARPAGLLGGVTGSFVAVWPGHGEALTAVVMGLLLVAFLHRWTDGRVSHRGSLLLGVGIGAAFHLQPALLPVMLGCLGFELWWNRSRRNWSRAAVLVLGAVLACIPWAWRNHAVLGGHFFIRSNFGLELRMGNHDGAAAHMNVMDARGPHRHPRTHTGEAERVRTMGEVEYMRDARREAVAWVRANPGEFLRLTGARFLNVWFGPLHEPLTAAAVTLLTLLALVGAWRAFPGMSVPQRAAVVIPLAAYPLVYYFVGYMGRYRMPLDWLFFLLAGAAFFGTRGGESTDGL